MQIRSRVAGSVLLVLLVAGSLLTRGPALVRAHAESEHFGLNSCDNATIRGTYGFQRNGTTSTGPLTATGLAQFDGIGSSVAQQTISRSGKFTNVTDQVGTYTVNPDCTGTETDVNGNVFAYLVVVHNGGEILGMSMTAGNNVAIHFERIIDWPGNPPMGVSDGHDQR